MCTRRQTAGRTDIEEVRQERCSFNQRFVMTKWNQSRDVLNLANNLPKNVFFIWDRRNETIVWNFTLLIESTRLCGKRQAIVVPPLKCPRWRGHFRWWVEPRQVLLESEGKKSPHSESPNQSSRCETAASTVTWATAPIAPIAPIACHVNNVVNVNGAPRRLCEIKIAILPFVYMYIYILYTHTHTDR